MGHEGVPASALDANCELIIDMPAVRHLLPGQHHEVGGDGREAFDVPRGVPAPALVPALEHGELGPEHQALELVDSAVHADLVVNVDGLHAVDAQAADLGGQGLVVPDEGHARVAEGAQVLGGVEAAPGHLAELARGKAPALGAQ